VYYFESVISPNTYWVEMKNIDFSANAKTKMLTVALEKPIMETL